MHIRVKSLPLRFILTPLIFLLFLWLVLRDGGLQQRKGEIASFFESQSKPSHPIDTLILAADERFNEILGTETHGLKDAVEAYKRRRRRHPPPGFDAWVRYAEANNALIVEEFFDRIYHDLGPFWAIPAEMMRDSVAAWPEIISVRSGNIISRADGPEIVSTWYNIYKDMFSAVAEHLPDVDIALNLMDESRLLVPWDEIREYVEKNIRLQENALERSPSVTEFRTLEPPKHQPDLFMHGFSGKAPLWRLVRLTCPPNSPGRDALPDTDYTKPAYFPQGFPAGSHQGFVSNWTTSQDICVHAHLKDLHGSFVEPVSLSSSQRLFPLFGGSKFLTNNEILIPPVMYWTDDTLFEGGSKHTRWYSKSNKMVWRGVASGGRNTAKNWRHFQRHRFVSMMNGTTITAAEKYERGIRDFEDVPAFALNFPFEQRNLYNVTDTTPTERLGEWLDSFSDVGLVSLACFPKEKDKDPGSDCPYVNRYYHKADRVTMEEQYHYKYLPDVDGNSYSGRWRAFLRSYSLPLKATIYTEWHDSRIIPWKHFVPFDNTYIDLWAIFEYFLGYPTDPKKPSRDAVAKRIAESGQQWAERVYRKEDMLIYVYRLVLEYNRLMDPRREEMGFELPT